MIRRPPTSTRPDTLFPDPPLLRSLEVRRYVELRSPEPGPTQVLVRIERAGLCHSDVSVIDGTIPFPTPVVLGHEGAGVVEAVGDAVSTVAVGDHVVLTTLSSCGRCAACDRGEPTPCRSHLGRLPRPFHVSSEDRRVGTECVRQL